MKIHRLSVSNFRQHRNLMLDLSEGQSDFVVIRGRNGAGKTNLLNSIIWALYGREDFFVRRQEGSPLVSQSLLLEINDGQHAECKVELDISFESGAKAHIVRSQDFVKNGISADPLRNSSLSVSFMSEVGQGFKSEPNPEDWIEQWVPSRLEPYFLFDGERLDDFFRKESATKVKNAVLQIAQIDVLGRTLTHLEQTYKSLLASGASDVSDTDVTAWSEKLASAEKLKADIEAELAPAREQLDDIAAKHKDLDHEIGKIESVARDSSTRRSLEEQISHQDSVVKSAWEDYYRWAVISGPSILLREPLVELQGVISETRRKGELPPPIAPEVLEEILSKDECLCGRSVCDDSSTVSHIQSLLEKYLRIGELGAVLYGLENLVNSLVDKSFNSVGDQELKSTQVRNSIDRLSELEGSLNTVKARLEGTEDVQASNLLERLESLRTKREDTKDRVLGLERDLKQALTEIDISEKNLQSHLNKSNKASDLALKAAFAKHCLDLVTEIHEALTNEVRDEVALRLDEQFKAMIWKQGFVDRVSIDENFIVSVKNSLGYEILPDLSAGERECLAFAFSLALSGVAGYELPMVIDTPFGIMSPEVQQNVAKALAENTANNASGLTHQLLLLVTETEYNDEVASVVAFRKPKIYDLEFSSESSTAELVEVK